MIKTHWFESFYIHDQAYVEGDHSQDWMNFINISKKDKVIKGM